MGKDRKESVRGGRGQEGKQAIYGRCAEREGKKNGRGNLAPTDISKSRRLMGTFTSIQSCLISSARRT